MQGMPCRCGGTGSARHVPKRAKGDPVMALSELLNQDESLTIEADFSRSDGDLRDISL
jgi:hypothetical protein